MTGCASLGIRAIYDWMRTVTGYTQFGVRDIYTCIYIYMTWGGGAQFGVRADRVSANGCGHWQV